MADGAFLYVIGYGNMMKVGITNDPHSRLRTMQTGVPEMLHMYYLCAMARRSMARKAEIAIHKRLADRRVRGEWFRIDAEDAAEAASAVIRRQARCRPQVFPSI